MTSDTTKRGRLWHPFADMSEAAGRELVIQRGEGIWVFDEQGKRYLDATAGLWYCNVGHGRSRLAAAAADQMRRLASYQIFDTLANRPALDLADRVCELAPMGESSAAFLTSGGSDGIDTAAKIARRFWRLQGETDRTVVVAREGAYHGMHAYGTALSGIEGNAAGWGPLITDVVHVPRHDLGALQRTLDENRGRVAALIGEPAQGAAGVHPPNEDYWPGVQDLCERDGILLIVDEVVTGFGRLGTWFAAERFGIEPDMIVCAKGLSSGYAPIGAVIASARVIDVMWDGAAGYFRHGYTYSGHPTASAVALENLAVLAEEELIVRVAGLEPYFSRAFRQLADHPIVADVRSIGLLAGVELRGDALARGALGSAIAAARDRGVLTRGLVGRTLQFSPPFVIEENEVDLLIGELRVALDVCAEALL